MKWFISYSKSNFW